MLREARKELIKYLLPEMIERLDPDKLTLDDMKIALGWNLYREELLKRLKIK